MEVFSDLALSLGTLAPVKDEERDKDDNDDCKRRVEKKVQWCTRSGGGQK